MNAFDSVIGRVLPLGLVATIFLAGCESPTQGFNGNPDLKALRANEWILAAVRSPSAREEDVDVDFTADFSENGEISGRAGPNEYGGTYIATPEGYVSIDELGSTLIGGEEAEIAADYLAILSNVSRFGVDGDEMRLWAGGTSYLHFQQKVTE